MVENVIRPHGKAGQNEKGAIPRWIVSKGEGALDQNKPVRTLTFTPEEQKFSNLILS